MPTPVPLNERELTLWLAAHPAWSVADHPPPLGKDAANPASPPVLSLNRAYAFRDFATALAFAVRVGMLAERNDHHPDIALGWGWANVRWTTHDARGITALDVKMAEATDGIYS